MSDPFAGLSVKNDQNGAAYGGYDVIADADGDAYGGGGAYGDDNDSLWGTDQADSGVGQAVVGSGDAYAPPPDSDKQGLIPFGNDSAYDNTGNVDSDMVDIGVSSAYGQIGSDLNSGTSSKQSSSKDAASDPLAAREENLRRKEEELRRRKDRLDKMESDIDSGSYREDNWPCSSYPLTYHSITQEIPVYARSHMTRMYILVLIDFLALLWNVIACIAADWSTNKFDDELVFWAIVYFCLGVIGGWKGWYRQIYYGIRDGKTLKWWMFFGVFALLHCTFCTLASVAPAYWPTGVSGFWILADVFDDSAAAGIVCLVASLLWFLLATASWYMLYRSWKLYQSSGGMAKAQNEIAREALRQSVTHAANAT